jgi:hypothetical protein
MLLSIVPPSCQEDYTKLRCSKHYKVSEEELDWLGERVEELGCTVYTMCSVRIERLERYDGSHGALS